MSLAIIPARGGSKRIPRKNIREFAGKPIIAYAIQAALDSGCFERVIVSTDDAEIADVARHYGAEIPFVRPPELSDDYAGTLDVIAHALKELGYGPGTTACCIYATAPFVRPEDIAAGFTKLADADVDYAFSVTSFPFPVQRGITLSDSGSVKMLFPENFSTRSQDLPDVYHDAGQFYWGKTEAFLSRAVIFSERARGVVLPRYRVQDIDTLEDWHRAELMWKVLQVSGDDA